MDEGCAETLEQTVAKFEIRHGSRWEKHTMAMHDTSADIDGLRLCLATYLHSLVRLSMSTAGKAPCEWQTF